MLILDSRGNGRSNVVLTQTLQQFGAPPAQARYLRHLRANSIVRDVELICQQLLGEDSRWTASCEKILADRI